MDLDLERFEQPRERLAREGAQALSLAELITIVLGSGGSVSSGRTTAGALVTRFSTLDALERAGDAELSSIAGVGPAKLAALRAAFELGARLARQPLVPGAKLTSPEQVCGHFGTRLRRERQERFYVLLLDSRHRLIREVEVSRGSLNQSLVHPREVFAPALREAAAAICAVHNHPSGDPQPSPDDHEVTRRLTRAGEILGIPLVDHVVVAGEAFASFARSGWLSGSSRTRAAPNER